MLITLGGYLFWTIVALFVIIVVTFSEKNIPSTTEIKEPTFLRPFLLHVMFISVFYIMYHKEYSFEFQIFSIILYTTIYCIIGILWSFFKWMKFVKSIAGYYKKYNVSSFRRPDVTENKANIASWIVFWPYSVIRYIIVSLLGDIFDRIFSWIKGIYESITDSYFKNEEHAEIQ